MLEANEGIVEGIQSWNENILVFDLEQTSADGTSKMIRESLLAYDPYEPGSCGAFSCSGYWGAF